METSEKKNRPTFENEKKVAEYQLTHNGEVRHTGTANECYMKLQRSQSQSANWAIKYEGWKVVATGKEIDDPRITVTVLQDSNRLANTVMFEYRGKRYQVRKDCVYGHSELVKGEQVEIDSTYAYLAD